MPENIQHKLPTTDDGAKRIAGRPLRFPRRMIPVIAIVVLLITTNFLLFQPFLHDLARLRPVTLSQVVTGVLSLATVLCGVPMVVGLLTRRKWGLTTAKAFLPTYCVAMIAKHWYFSPLVRDDWRPFAIMYWVWATFFLSLMLVLLSSRVRNYYDDP